MSKILTIWTNLNKTAKIAVAVFVVVVVGLTYKSCASDKAMAEWRRKYDDFRTAAAVATHKADSLQQIANAALVRADHADSVANGMSGKIAQRDSTIARLKAQTAVIHHENDSTFEALTQGQPEAVVVVANPQSEAWVHITFRLHDENALLIQSNTMLSVQVDELEQRDQLRLSSIMELRKSVSSLQERGDSLQAIINRIPSAPPREKFLFIPLPSRKMSLFIGVGLGIVGDLLFQKHVVK